MKVPEPRKLSSGNWFIQLRLGGVSYPVTASTAKECKRQAALIKAEHGAGKRIKPQHIDNMTLRQAIDHYIARRSNVLSPSTIDGYRRIQKNRFQSVMDKKVKDISDWQKICNAESRLCAPKTLKNAYGLVTSVLNENGIATQKVKLPQTITNARDWLEPDQIITLVNHVRGKNEELSVLFALHGLRRSEIGGLTWENINLKNNLITIRGAVVANEKHQFVYKETSKNETSNRTVPIMIPELADALKNVKNKSGAVMTCNPNTICSRINKACKEADLPEVGTHGLRHSFASLAYHLKLSAMETKELGGWADNQTMEKIYTHLAKKDRLKAKNKMTNFFNNANANANEDIKASVIKTYSVD